MILHFYRHDNTHRQEAVLLQCAHQKTISFLETFRPQGEDLPNEKNIYSNEHIYSGDVVTAVFGRMHGGIRPLWSFAQ